MRAKLRARVFDASGKLGRRRGELGGKRGGRKFEIAQSLIGLDRARAFAELCAGKPTEVAALILQLGGAAGDGGHHQKSARMAEARGKCGTQHLYVHERQRVVKLERRAESLGRARKQRNPERVALGDRPQLERRLRDYSERAERAGHHLHQIIAGDVFDYPAAAVYLASLVADETHADQQVARRALGKPERAGVRRPDQRAERGRAGTARVEREALSVLSQALVERTERHPGLGDHRHVFGLVGNDTVHARE